MKNKFFVIAPVITIVTMLLPFFAMAQDPGCGPDCPVDGGLGFLLVAGAGYGVKKYRDAKSKQKIVEQSVN
jgi:hypothetical protein